MAADVVAERTVLAGIFRHGFAAYVDAVGVLSPEGMTVEGNRLWYRTLSSFFEDEKNQRRTPDSPTLLSVADDLGYGELLQSPDVRGMDLLRGFANFPVHLESVLPAAKRVAKLHVARLLSAECRAAAEEVDAVTGGESISAILGLAENRVLEFANRHGGDGEEAIILGSQVGEYYQRLKETARPSGIRVGWPAWEEAIGGGLLANCLDLIVARAKAGKGLTKISMALGLIRQGIPVFDVDTEMTKEEQMRRLMATMSRVSERKIRDGEFVGDTLQEAALEAAVHELQVSGRYYHRYVGDRTPDEILSLIRRWLIKEVGLDEFGHAKPCVVFYDYIKLMQASDLRDGSMSEHQSIGFLTVGLKNLVGKYNARCIAFAQQNREGLDSDDERGIALSDRLTWFPTSVSILRWQTPDELAEQDPACRTKFSHKLIPVLSRHGGRWPRGEFIHVKANLDTCTMMEGPTSVDYRQAVQLGNITF